MMSVIVFGNSESSAEGSVERPIPLSLSQIRHGEFDSILPKNALAFLPIFRRFHSPQG
jgi:hypothetical protein